MRKSATFLAILILTCWTSASAQSSETATCAKGPGAVLTSNVARETYLAAANQRGDNILGEIVVSDDGDRWSVAQRLPGTRGGGTLEMEIKKCDGSISTRYSR